MAPCWLLNYIFDHVLTGSQAWGEREVALKWLLSKRPHAFMTQENKYQAIVYLLERFDFTHWVVF